MTSIVGIRCSDGVVIGADSSATFGDGQIRTMEQPFDHKVEIIEDHVIVAGTGYVGHQQRFVEVVRRLHSAKALSNKTGIETAKVLSSEGIKDFASTHLQRIDFTALVAYPAKDVPCLCELPGGAMNFQPEIKDPKGLWFTSAGSGQSITDPFLALLKSVFWHDGPPKVRGGIFTALWALRHACDINPGGIKDPIHIAVLERSQKTGHLEARKLTEDELREHENMVSDATRHMRKYGDILAGTAEAPEPPTA